MLATLFGQTTGSPSTSAVNFTALHGVGDTPAATETARFQLMPAAFTLQNFYVSINNAPGSGKSYTFTIRKNQVDTAITITISNTDTSGTYSGAGVSFAAGDVITLGITPSGTPTAPTIIRWNLQTDSGGTHFAPIVGGQHATSGLNTASVTYAQLVGSSAGTMFDATEANVEIIIPCAGTLNNLYVQADAVAGTGKTWAMGLVKNGSLSTLSASITGNSVKTGNDTTHSISVAAGDTLSMAATPSGTPTVSRICWSLQFTPTNPGETFFGFGNSVAPSTTATVFEMPLGVGTGSYSATESTRQVAPGACMLTALYAALGTAPGGVTTRTLTIRRGSVSSPLAVAFTGAAVTGNHSGENVGLGQTDLISLQASETGTPAADTGGVHVGILQFISTAAANTTNFLEFV